MEGSADRSSSVVDSDEVFNDELKNPFADSEDEYEASTAPSGSRLLTQASALPGDSDRPKSTPPPPPPMSCSFSDKTLKNPVSMEERFRTLRVFNKLRTLHPPIAMRGKVKFTENSALGDTNEIIKKTRKIRC
ncbi:hypothetical protein KIN20_023272 [Parelaphostrongylus tenuis]|uniref:Uncharacterized protein n=1 Tax=Parelaphostrongylus tenuis TaxID=148309 RepID=A0AAD5N9Z0_PARTN|nr:hypothetical protein KIN20_023272 [Parelaphostrongylus tenuis]